MPKKAKTSQPVTTAQRLSSLVKSCRDIMRKDKGLNGDLDRLPMLTWILFLKFLDDLELQHEAEALIANKRYRATIEPPYRWRDWAGRDDGITGEDLISFINNEESTRPDGSKGPGIFAYLRSLEGADGGDRRDVVRTVFQGVTNRMSSGFLLRDVLNKVNEIHFTSSEEIHTLSHLYETLLREMRDAAGDSGEFYTPRPLVRLIVDMIDPQLGEKVLDPACGTGGFLVETFEHLKKQCKKTEDIHRLQKETLFGVEAKTLPYLLCQMNLTLHGLELPNIDPLNALRFPLNEIGEKDRVDVIMTNPPFGGEEERGILSNFPEDRRTAETALLFLQLIMRKLKRTGGASRAAVVVPNGTLFGDGICAHIKHDLIDNFDLHTIVRLPNGVFAPYTSIPTNILFLEKGGPTREIWYYEHALPEGQKNYTKTKPLRDEEFASLRAWWGGRERIGRVENAQAWLLPAEKIAEGGWNLDVSNPRRAADLDQLPAEEVIESIIEKEKSILKMLGEVRAVLGTKS